MQNGKPNHLNLTVIKKMAEIKSSNRGLSGECFVAADLLKIKIGKEIS